MNYATSLVTGIFDTDPSGVPYAAKKAPFELRAASFLNYELQVISFEGRERDNDVYSYAVTFATEVSPDAIHSTLLGAPACLTVKSPGNAPQVIQGVISSLEGLGGVPGEQGSDFLRYRVTIVPKLWLLKRHRVNRVFQGETAQDIVEALLAPLGLAAAETSWLLYGAKLPAMPFMYQRNESDFDFLRRVLASAGLYFFFEHSTALPPSMVGGAGLSAAVSMAGISASASLGGLSASASASASASVGGFGASVSVGASAGSRVTVLTFAQRPTATPALVADSTPPAPTVGEFGVALSLPSLSVSASLGTGGSAAGATLLFDDGMGADTGAELVYDFGLKKQIRAQTLQLLERDVADGSNWIGQAEPPPSTLLASAVAASVGVSVGLGGVSVNASLGGARAAVPFGLDTDVTPASVLREENYQVDPNLLLDTSGSLTKAGPLVDPVLAIELARTRRKFLEAHGTTDCRRLGAGYRFTLGNHPIPALNQEYIVTSMSVKGHNPDFVKDSAVYRCAFRCIPSTEAPIPPRPKKRPKLGLEMAQVVAYTDNLKTPWLESSSCGYVKVRFRWNVTNTYGTPAGPLSAGATDAHAIWVPVMQQWAGAGYGAQFIPREGMDVLVGFLEEQGERPVILGCLYSAANLPPWSDKIGSQKIGIKSQTRAANGGYSEISIDDQQTGEVVTVRAQKDLVENVLNDRTATIGADDSQTVTADRTVSVGGDQVNTVTGNASQTVTGNASRTVTGTDTTSVTGDSTSSITGTSTTSVSGDLLASVTGVTKESLQGDVKRTLGGAETTTVAGISDHSFAVDYTERHLGHRTIIVGSGGAHRAAVLHVEGTGRVYSSMTLEVEVLQGFTLVCGSSQIVVSPTEIALTSPTVTISGDAINANAGTFAASATKALTLAGKTATMQTAGGKVALDSSSANVTGSQVNLGSGSGSLAPPSSQPVKVTKVQMKDATGKPRANARVLLTKGTGKSAEQRMTVLDADGELDLIGDTQYSISFPDDPVAK